MFVFPHGSGLRPGLQGCSDGDDLRLENATATPSSSCIKPVVWFQRGLYCAVFSFIFCFISVFILLRSSRLLVFHVMLMILCIFPAKNKAMASAVFQVLYQLGFTSKLKAVNSVVVGDWKLL